MRDEGRHGSEGMDILWRDCGSGVCGVDDGRGRVLGGGGVSGCSLDDDGVGKDGRRVREGRI